MLLGSDGIRGLHALAHSPPRSVSRAGQSQGELRVQEGHGRPKQERAKAASQRLRAAAAAAGNLPEYASRQVAEVQQAGHFALTDKTRKKSPKDMRAEQGL